MSLPHLFCGEPIEATPGERLPLPLDEGARRHLRSLRLRAGEHLVLIDSPGHGWEVELLEGASRRGAVIEGRLVAEHREALRPRLTLIQGISATDRMDLTVRQATELGLARIIPLESEYSTVRLEGAAREAKRRRWQRIARSAIEQSGRLSLPIIEAPLELEGALGLVGDCGPLLFFWEEPGGSALDDVLAATREEDGAAVSEAVILIGPEGGFSATEAELVQMAGAHTVTLGDAILRTETAALVASALVLYRLGGLGA